VRNRPFSMPVRTQVVILPRIGLFIVIVCPCPIVGARLFISDCGRRSGTTSGAIHTAMPRTIIVLQWVYIITASSYEYKDGVVGIFSFA